MFSSYFVVLLTDWVSHHLAVPVRIAQHFVLSYRYISPDVYDWIDLGVFFVHFHLVLEIITFENNTYSLIEIYMDRISNFILHVGTYNQTN